MTEYDELPEAVREALRDIRALDELFASDGWKILVTWMDTEIQKMRDVYELSGAITEGNIYQNEYLRAQLNMLRTIREMPEKLKDTAQAALDQHRPYEGDIDGTEEAPDFDGL